MNRLQLIKQIRVSQNVRFVIGSIPGLKGGRRHLIPSLILLEGTARQRPPVGPPAASSAHRGPTLISSGILFVV